MEAPKGALARTDMFAGVKTTEQAQAVIDAIGGVGCESVSTVRGYAGI